MQYVNIKGEPVSVAMPPKAAKPAKAAFTPFHKGFLVQGVPPGLYEKVTKEHAQAVAYAKKQGLHAPKPLLPKDEFIATAKLRKIRVKPYALYEAAQVCKGIAEKNGWDRVQIKELKQE